ncbi:Cytochrome c heme lyase subunit CcmH [Bathymodiolus thermophilus thioautotrophic gill symbiont]|uniref:c-type cytochrome biogenesis protein CcmI n=1 Tax=Bathymodiolus thermophilus thioautotrophic gill symbiont TaxID=2360 RepID=UPI0010B85BF6|nr:c-type cytochrome biogenesis protein CcmI [Bathymodiolus thermophilus thioautotrophic gill symbiont]SGZ90840.1 Cytochrome c heme lyase subunit CcmH [Bathymodiolus thermophilus thioautotrophic gill symbiont]
MSLYGWFAIMLAVSSVWLIWFLYRPLKGNTLDLEASNIALGKQKQTELEQDLQRDLIDDSAFEQAKDEIAQVLAVEMTQTITTVEAQKPIAIWLSVVLVAMLSGASLVVYQALTAQSITAQNATMAQTLQAQEPPTLMQSIVKIKKHLEENPDDAKAWKTLGLALFDADNLTQSLEAYERSYQLNPKDVGMLVEYASTLAKSQDNQFKGRVSTLVREALEINPNSTDALYLAGWVAANLQRLELTQMLWKKALSLLPENQAERMTLQRMLDELAQIQNNGVAESVKDKPAAQHQVVIKVALSEHLRQAKFKDYYLMVYVKAARGRPMPIAIQKIKLKDFTGIVTLTDANSVMPTRKLSQSSQVLAVVRLSQSGSAMRQADDLEALSQVIDVKDNPTVELKL